MKKGNYYLCLEGRLYQSECLHTQTHTHTTQLNVSGVLRLRPRPRAKQLMWSPLLFAGHCCPHPTSQTLPQSELGTEDCTSMTLLGRSGLSSGKGLCVCVCVCVARLPISAVGSTHSSLLCRKDGRNDRATEIHSRMAHTMVYHPVSVGVWEGGVGIMWSGGLPSFCCVL